MFEVNLLVYLRLQVIRRVAAILFQIKWTTVRLGTVVSSLSTVIQEVKTNPNIIQHGMMNFPERHLLSTVLVAESKVDARAISQSAD